MRAELAPLTPEREVLRRKSWVTAMPMLAKEREVRSHARNVRSACVSRCEGQKEEEGIEHTESKMVSGHASLVFQLDASVLIQ